MVKKEKKEKKDILEQPVYPDKWYNFVLSSKAQNFIIGLILLNAVTLGMSTSAYMRENFGTALNIFENVALAIYTVELGLKVLALRQKFFKSSWNLFDLFIVAIAYVPAVGPLSVLRSLRVLRVMRLITAIPRLRAIVRSLALSLPSIGWISFLLFLVFYIFAVMATLLFGKVFPDWFSTLGESYYTLFQVLTLESWSMGIVRPVMEKFPYAWLFFVPFILLTSFVVLNVFIAVIVGAMSDVRAEEKMQNAEEEFEEQKDSLPVLLNAEIQQLRTQLERLETLQHLLEKEKEKKSEQVD